jgi:hypothetical protein
MWLEMKYNQHFTLLMQKLDLLILALSNKFVYTCCFVIYFCIYKLLVLVKYSLKIQLTHLTVSISKMISSENPLFDPLTYTTALQNASVSYFQ